MSNNCCNSLKKKTNTTFSYYRMKCLEFLYFYLLDETGPPELALESKMMPAALPTELKHGSGSSTFSSSLSSSGRPSQPTISISSLSTPASSSPGKPLELSKFRSSFKTGPNTPRSSSKFPSHQPRHDIMMLKQDIDYEPLSPRKPGFREQVGMSTSRPRAQTTHGQQPCTPSRSLTHSSKLSISVSKNDFPGNGGDERRKTTDEKKKFLGTMLGNVDALVEGVRRAGIWHLD